MNHYTNTIRNGWQPTRRISGSTEISTEIAATAGQKRSRATQRSNYGNINCRSLSLGLVAAVATIVLFPAPSQGFQFRRAIGSSALDSGRRYTPENHNIPFSHQNRLAALHSTRSPSKSSNSSTAGGVVVEAVQPLRSESPASKKRRESLMQNLELEADARLVDTALEGIDAQVLELLMSEEFLYPSAQVSPKRGKRTLPNGRPASVAGAMSWKSLKKFQQRKGLMKEILDKTESTGTVREYIRQDLETMIGVRSEEVARNQEQVNRTRGRKSKVTEDVLPEAAAVDTNEITKPKKKATRKRRVVKKNLPSRRKVNIPLDDSERGVSGTDDFIKSRSRPGKSRIPGNTYRGKESANAELRKYFDTELLTGEEEYIIGEKIQHIVQYDQVHEGLCLKEMRLPTIAEWAAACGYTEEQDGEYVVSEILERKIRPAGFDMIFKKVNPDAFVGNGLASTVGVGRGRGRQKSPSPAKIPKDLYKMDRNTGKKIGGAKAKPVNRGTIEDFCNVLVDGRNAKQLMIQSNMRLVISIARKYSKVGVSLYDLVQEGSVGLSRAAEKFDPTKGFKFSTYASWWIQQAVFRSIAYHSRTIRLPVHIHNMMNRIRKVKSSLEAGLGRHPTDEEMAEALDMPISKYERMMKLTRRTVSLESKQYKQNPKDFGFEGEDSIGDMTSTEREFDSNLDDENISPEKSVDRGLFRDDLEEMLLSLNEGEQTVIRLRYGIADGLTRTVTATAAKLNQTPAWVRSQESKALRKLRRPWYEQKLKEHQMSLLG